MANQMTKARKIILLIGDLIILYSALVITLLIRYGIHSFATRFKPHLGPFSAIFIIWILIFYLSDLYRYKIFRSSLLLLKNLSLAVSIALGSSIIAFYLFSSFFELTPKTNLFIFGIACFALNYLWRHLMFRGFRTGAANIIILGDSPLIRTTISYLEENPQNGYRVVHNFKNQENLTIQELREIIQKNNASMVIVSALTKETRNIELAYKLLPLEVTLLNFWDFYEAIFEKVPLNELEENWFIENVATRRKFYDALKRMIDVSLAFIFSIIFIPFILLIWILIKIFSRGPAIYKQKRVGKNEKLFTLYKFRTMQDGNNGPLWTTPQDTRITGIGKILRWTHLDELPQLLNILKNDISFIGPRPERSELVEQYKKFPYYEIRHIIKPGLTGWAQINFRPSASFKEAHEKLCYDIYYIKNRSLFLDVLIILKTIRYLFVSYGA